MNSTGQHSIIDCMQRDVSDEFPALELCEPITIRNDMAILAGKELRSLVAEVARSAGPNTGDLVRKFETTDAFYLEVCALAGAVVPTKDAVNRALASLGWAAELSDMHAAELEWKDKLREAVYLVEKDDDPRIAPDAEPDCSRAMSDDEQAALNAWAAGLADDYEPPVIAFSLSFELYAEDIAAMKLDTLLTAFRAMAALAQLKNDLDGERNDIWREGNDHE